MREVKHLWLKSIFILLKKIRKRLVVLLDKTLFPGWDRVESFEAALKLPFGPLIRWIEHLGLHGGK